MLLSWNHPASSFRCRLTSFSCTNMIDVEQLSTGMINSLIFSVAYNTESYLQLCTFSLNVIVHMNIIASVIFISHCFTYTCTMVNQSHFSECNVSYIALVVHRCRKQIRSVEAIRKQLLVKHGGTICGGEIFKIVPRPLLDLRYWSTEAKLCVSVGESRGMLQAITSSCSSHILVSKSPL